MGLRERLAPVLILTVALAACVAPPAPTSRSGSPDAAAPSAAPKRLTTAIRGNPHTVFQKLNPRSNIPGIDQLENMVNAPLSVVDERGNLQPRLGEAVPSIENGLWKLLPEGRMETTWTIRPGTRWQDGQPLTAHDLVFTVMVGRDRDLPIFGDIAFRSLEAATAVDDRTVSVTWSSPFFQADNLFSHALALPMPKHILDRPYAEEKLTFVDHPYWSEEFVGTGPYKIRTWERGSHLVLEANDLYVLGRPKIDEVVVKFIPDPSTLAANVLAGEVDVTMEGRLSIEWATTVRDQWPDGKVDFKYSSMIQIFPQFINPTPSVVGNLQFRRAMLTAIDRQQMVDTFLFGLTSVGHTFVAPTEPEYAYVEPRIVRYDYDAHRAAQMIESLGYRKAADGLVRDAAGEKLALQIRTSQGDDRQEKAMYATADDWQRLGIDVERYLVPPQRASDAEFRATFPAFDLKGQAGTFDYAPSFHSRGIGLPENNFLVSGNNARYSNPDLDLLIERYYVTIPLGERMQVAGDVVHHLSDQVAWMGLFYQVVPILISNRLQNVTQPKAARSTTLSNIHLWDVK